ncbi:hypothetical protein KHP57_16075, partial [Algiphilus sp. NNCM1]|nr:hypothetical protein [Algiphilus acroporae]
RVTDIMAEISSASAEQSSGIEQVSQTVTQMDEVTQQNASLVEEASAAARSLEDQAKAMEALVQRFRFSEEVTREAQRRSLNTRPPASQRGPGAGQQSVHSAARGAAEHAVASAITTPVEALSRATAAHSINGHAPSVAHKALNGSAHDDDQQWTNF